MRSATRIPAFSRIGAHLLVAALLLGGCGGLPRGVANRPAFTGFDPSGTWYVSGERRSDGQKYQTTATVTVKGRFLEIRREGDEATYFGLADERGLFFAAGPANLHLITDGETLAGVWGNPGLGLGYEEFRSTNDVAHERGGGFSPAQKRVAITPSGGEEGGLLEVKGDTRIKFTYSAYASNAAHTGAGIVLGDRIALATVETRSLATSRAYVTPTLMKVTTVTTFHQPGAYALVGLILEGDRLVGKGLAGVAKGDDAGIYEHVTETWSRTAP